MPCVETSFGCCTKKSLVIFNSTAMIGCWNDQDKIESNNRKRVNKMWASSSSAERKKERCLFNPYEGGGGDGFHPPLLSHRERVFVGRRYMHTFIGKVLGLFAVTHAILAKVNPSQNRAPLNRRDISCFTNDTETVRAFVGGNSSGKSFHIVVARYEERLSHLAWMSKYPHTVYNRGDLISNDEEINKNSSYSRQFLCPDNIGRESFLYLFHIVNTYHNLDDVLIFTQADNGKENEMFRKKVENLITGREHFSLENDGFAFFLNSCASAFEKLHMDHLGKTHKIDNVASVFHKSFKGVGR